MPPKKPPLRPAVKPARKRPRKTLPAGDAPDLPAPTAETLAEIVREPAGEAASLRCALVVERYGRDEANTFWVAEVPGREPWRDLLGRTTEQQLLKLLKTLHGLPALAAPGAGAEKRYTVRVANKAWSFREGALPKSHALLNELVLATRHLARDLCGDEGLRFAPRVRTFAVGSGRFVSLIALAHEPVYAGQMEGDRQIGSHYARLRVRNEFAKELRRGGALIVDDGAHALPRYEWRAELVSAGIEHRADPAYYSKLTLVWYTDDEPDSEREMLALVLPQVDWEQHAREARREERDDELDF